MDFKYTKHQVARGALPDVELHDKIILIKRCSELRLTYQIRLLAYLAQQKHKKLVIELPKGAKVHKSLNGFRNQMAKIIEIVRN